MKQTILFLIFVCTLSSLSFAQTDSKSVSIDDNIKKAVITESVAKEAYLWGYPLVHFERLKKLMTMTPGYGHAPINYFFHANRLPTPQDRDVSNPIPDSLYSSAFLDLREQPMILETPKIKGRYYSLQVYDALNNNIAIISSRTRGETGGKFFITGPRFIGSTPAGFEHIHVSTNFAWINGRIQTESPSEVKKAYKFIRKYTLKPYTVYLGKQRMGTAPPLKAAVTAEMDPRSIPKAGLGFYDELGQALRENEPANLDAAMINRFRTANIGAGLRTSRLATGRQLRDSYIRAIAASEIGIDNAVKRSLVTRRGGWNYVLPSSESLKSNPVLRAAMSKVYFGQSAPLESVHPVSYVDNENILLNGNATYILRFAKGQLPPVGAYWSVTPYAVSRKSLVANNMKRYAVASYSKNLNYNPDGSLDIYVSANEPRGFTQNWLPVPRENFYIMMSLYNPTTDVIQGKYKLPRVQRVNLTPVLSLNK